VRLLIVEVPGVLYPSDHVLPRADPIVSGLRFVRALSEGYGVSTLMVANAPEVQLRAWLKIYNVETTWVVSGDGSKAPLDFWTTDVLTFIGKLNATPTVAVTAHTPTAKMLASRAIPVVRYHEPDGIMPDWGPTNSSWADKAPEPEE
jgi:hypothetical protein